MPDSAKSSAAVATLEAARALSQASMEVAAALHLLTSQALELAADQEGRPGPNPLSIELSRSNTAA